MPLSQRTILYTGAAGGLGLDTTLDLMQSGATVVAVDNDLRKAAALEQAAAGVGPGRLLLERLDLGDHA
ncbi:MAG: SDR family NAD(P)-dependent oxidoreductase, partial [Methylobacteriaceae bacterium]|nr:SDR family NAD(P)-dependent oxidoreductase [Methylobacteriaceae bacterium]